VIRCALLELFFPGAGHALSGSLARAIGWLAATVAIFAAMLWTPWVVWLAIVARLVSIVHVAWCVRRRPERWAWKPMLLVGAVALGTFTAARQLAFEGFKIPSASMVPTLKIDDLIMTDKLSLRWRAPERGEVIVFWRVPGRAFVSRVIAVGGDTVAVTGGVVQVNGRALPRREVGPTTYLDRNDVSGVTTEQAHAWIEELGGHTYRVQSRSRAWNTEQSDYPLPGNEDCALRGRPDDGVPLEPVTDGCRVPPGTLFVMGDNRENSADSRYWGAVRVDAVIGRVTGIWFGGIEGRWSRMGAID